MIALTSIPIECWVCDTTYSVPATITLIPFEADDVLTREIAAGVWIQVDQTLIRTHVNEHWSVLVLWFFMWRAFVDITGIDVLEYYQ